MAAKVSGKRRKPVFDSAGYQAGLCNLNGEELPRLHAVVARPLGGGARSGAEGKPLPPAMSADEMQAFWAAKNAKVARKKA